jgi:hypothetical protein
LDLEFSAPHVRYDLDRDIVTFSGKAGADLVHCAVSGEALEDHFCADEVNQDARVKIFRANRSTFEKMARTKYLTWEWRTPAASSSRQMTLTSSAR